MFKKIILFVWTFSILFSASVQVWASCVGHSQQPPCYEFWQADAVFIATATNVEYKQRNPDFLEWHKPMVATLKIEESFRGITEKEVVLDLESCGYEFKEGEKYLVYARRKDNNKLFVGVMSSRTQPLAEAGEDLQYIRSVLRGEKQPKIVGTVGQNTRNVKTIQDSPRKYTFDILAPRFTGKPAPGVRVFAEGANQIYETITDGEGIYQFFDLPDGEYKIRAEFPSYFLIKDETVRTRKQGCALAYLNAERQSAIAGRILDANGNPLKRVYISLVSAEATPNEIFEEKPDASAWTHTMTGENGEYNFAHLPAGNYFIVVNRGERERNYGGEEAQKLPRLFYAGVTSLEKATVVSIKEGEQVKGKDFRLPKSNQ